MNNYEFNVISRVISLDNVVWWHRIDDKRKEYSFKINGFINHYPDFLILTKKNTLILVEVKGEQLANPESKNKLELGKSGSLLQTNLVYRINLDTFMVFITKPMEGAKSLDELIETISLSLETLASLGSLVFLANRSNFDLKCHPLLSKSSRLLFHI